MTGSRSFTAAACATLYLCTLHAMADTPALRQAWVDARTAITESQAELPRERSLRRYVLYPYLEAAAIIAGLRIPERYERSLADASEFLETYRDTAIADAFHRDLLFGLSELNAWPDFVAFYTQEIANESRECEYLRARVSLGMTEALAPLIEQRWLTPRRLDSACEPAFQWLRDTGILDEALTAQRLTLLLESGQTRFARIIAARLPEAERRRWLQWADMLDAPLPSFDAVIRGELRPDSQALRSAWSRASTQTPAQTLARLADLPAIAEPTSETARAMIRDLALGLAWDRRPEALEVFRRFAPEEHDDYSLGWLARSALWNSEWALAANAIGAMTANERQSSNWMYWHGRAAMQLGRTEDAVDQFAALQDRDNFYSATAAARLSLDVVPNNQPAATPATLAEQLGETTGFLRARELFLIGERIAATREWQYATRDLNSAQLTAAMQLASDWGWHDMAVATATRAEVYFDYRRLYPMPYGAEIATAAAAQNLDDALLGALIRQESMFRPDAISGAGAIGLTQLGLATARNTAQAFGLPRPNRADLFEPTRNTHLGAATLRSGLQRFAQQLPVALAAYNAGPAAAERWLPDNPIDADIWIENIPFNETREYVRRVLWNSVVYAWLLGDEAPVDTGYLLGQITPLEAPER